MNKIVEIINNLKIAMMLLLLPGQNIFRFYFILLKKLDWVGKREKKRKIN